MDKMFFINSKTESKSVPFGSILEETREKTVVENEDTLLSCAISGIYRNDELFTHFRGSSNIGYIKIKKNDLILSAQNLHLGNANVNLRFEHGIISPAYKAYKITGAVPEYMAQWVKRPQANQFFLDATTEGASQCRKNIDWDTLYARNIQLPSVEVQRKTAELLTLVDTKINYEKTEVEKLKALKASMLAKMFPKDRESTPEIRFKGFTEPWEQYKWNEHVDISTEMVNPADDEYTDMPHIAPGNIESFTGQILDNVKTVREENLISGKFRFRPGDVVYGKINPQLGKYFYASVDGLTSADAYVFKGKNGLTQKFLFAMLQTNDFYKYSVSVSKRSGMPKINRDELNAYSFFAPNIDEQEKIGDYLLKLDSIIALHQRKYEKLLDTKKAFLEKLIGGDN